MGLFDKVLGFLGGPTSSGDDDSAHCASVETELGSIDVFVEASGDGPSAAQQEIIDRLDEQVDDIFPQVIDAVCGFFSEFDDMDDIRSSLELLTVTIPAGDTAAEIRWWFQIDLNRGHELDGCFVYIRDWQVLKAERPPA